MVDESHNIVKQKIYYRMASGESTLKLMKFKLQRALMPNWPSPEATFLACEIFNKIDGDCLSVRYQNKIVAAIES